MSLLPVLLLAACAPGPGGVDVAEPIVITVVVIPTADSPAGASPTASSGPSRTPTPQKQTASPYPAPFQATVDAVYQDFENGFMIYLSDRKAIWAFTKTLASADGKPMTVRNLGQWFAFEDAFEDGQPETDPAFEPPAGFQQPKRGFGKVWRENESLRRALGWGLDFELPYEALVADYSIGILGEAGEFAPRSVYHIVTTPDGSRIHIDEAMRLWSRP